VAAPQRLVETWAGFQQSMVDDAIDHWQKTWSVCLCRRWSLWTVAVTLLDWHSSCHTSQTLFSEPTFEGKQYTFNQMNKFCISQGSAVTFVRCVGKFTVTVTVRFIMRMQSEVCISSIVESDFFEFPKVKWLQLNRWGGEIVSFWCQNFSGFHSQKSLKWVNFWRSYSKNKKDRFLGQCISSYFWYEQIGNWVLCAKCPQVIILFNSLNIVLVCCLSMNSTDICLDLLCSISVFFLSFRLFLFCLFLWQNVCI